MYTLENNMDTDSYALSETIAGAKFQMKSQAKDGATNKKATDGRRREVLKIKQIDARFNDV